MTDDPRIHILTTVVRDYTDTWITPAQATAILARLDIAAASREPEPTPTLRAIGALSERIRAVERVLDGEGWTGFRG